MRKGQKTKGKMANNVKIDQLTDPVLIAKLQAISPIVYLKMTILARKLLHEKCDDLIKQYGIIIDSIQPARKTG